MAILALGVIPNLHVHVHVYMFTISLNHNTCTHYYKHKPVTTCISSSFGVCIDSSISVLAIVNSNTYM